MDNQLFAVRHSLAHVLAQAVQRQIDPFVHLGTGPAIDDGFYYDMKFSEGVAFGEDLLKQLEKTMQKIVKENQPFMCYTAKNPEEARHLVGLMRNPFKQELVEKFLEQDLPITFYCNTINVAAKQKLLEGVQPGYYEIYDQVSDFFSFENQYVTFFDLCEGGHVETTKEIPDGCFALSKIAGAYRRGDDKNPMMTRVYGLAFATKDELKQHCTMLEEARKRDHRVLGKKMELFCFSDLVGAGFPLLQPNGMIVREELINYLWELHKPHGYYKVHTPHLAKVELYKCSGHYELYKENFAVKGKEEDFMVKPMNCPHHMQIFAASKWSYRDMPVRYFEPGTVYRDEKSGQLSGLTRVRAITQDDGHLFCRVDQIEQEVGVIVGIIHQFYQTMGMLDGYWVSLSVRGDADKYLGSDEVWEKAESALKSAADTYKLPYQRMEGEAAFYGPKLDFMFKDAIGRPWQLATIQLDFTLPERFDLSYTNTEGQQERPVVIHRAISGSLERFMGVMIEHFAGAFPLWLAPVQMMIIPVAEKFVDYAYQCKQKAVEQGLRVQIDDGDMSFSKKIREAELKKIPYIAIVGEKEETDGTLSMRVYKTKQQFTDGSDTIINNLVTLYQTRALD